MKTFWAALLAFVAANIVLGVLFFMMFFGVVAMMGDPVPVVSRGSILKIDLTRGINDSPSASPIKNVGLSGVEFDYSNTIMQALGAIERASQDDNIRGIYINITGMNISTANMEELRAAIDKFKNSGKFVISYSDVYSQGSYYFASVADRVYINPQGSISWRGLAAQVMFYKGLLDKLGIEPEILRHGNFKAAVEPFMLDRMSADNRLQMTTYVNSVWGTLLHDISLSRGIDSAVLSNYATELSLRSAEHAVEYGFADAMMYEDQAMLLLGRLSGGIETVEQAELAILGRDVETLYNTDDVTQEGDSGAEEEIPVTRAAYEEKDPVFVTLSDYIAAGAYNYATAGNYKNKIAVIYADGDIIDGESEEKSIGGATIAAKIAKARKDKNVKAVVLRVNSPGGSALASEVMWREMVETRQIKPVIVSMGGMAASGGYYISCPADVILANRTTLTGSIGVFGLMFNMRETFRDKLGITVDVARTNPSADMGSPFRGLSAHEREVLMYSVEQVYGTFVGHVADGRNLTEDYVDSIGGGRIWTGASAIEIGLIDGFGGIKDAIELAADRAGVAGDYMTWEVVDAMDNFSAIAKAFFASSEAKANSYMGEAFAHYDMMIKILSQQGTVQARMPYVVDIY